MTLAAALLTNINEAEDAVHDVFVSFIKLSEKFHLTGSLKAYLATCVANNARNRNKSKQRHPSTGLDEAEITIPDINGPELTAIFNEELRRLTCALGRLPYEQREVLMLYIYSGLKFAAIARLQAVSINTVQGRYRYALDKLRSLLNREVKNETGR